MIRLFLIALLICSSLRGTTYYVDFDGGSDSNNGTSSATPWKHCKGDSNATGNAASATFVPDDVILFKGGVNYRGSITTGPSGTSGHPITYKGDGWGVNKAILNGAVPFTKTWTQCTGPSDCYDNPNWANIWYADVEFVGQTATNTLILNDEFLPMAQSNAIASPILWDIVTEWRTTASSNLTISTLTDASYLTQSTTDFWAGAYIGIHKSPNSVVLRLITAFDPATDKITFGNLSNTEFYNPSPYAILGHPFNVTSGTYAVIGSRIWYWPAGGVNPNSQYLEVGKLAGALTVGGESYITMTGFKVVGYYGDISGVYDGYGVSQSGSGSYAGMVITNCDFKNIRSMGQGPVLNIQNFTSCTVSGNTISQCLRSRGMICSGSNYTVSNNTLSYMGGTAIYFAGVANGLISQNTLRGIRGTHGNGISVYQGSSNVTVERNYLTECGNPITYEHSSNVYFYNNFADCTYGVVDEWGYMSGLVKWINNTLVNSSLNTSLNLDRSTSTATYEIKNNILDGLSWNTYPTDDPDVVHQYNIWVGYFSGYAPPTLGVGEVYKPVLTQTFVDPAGGNYTPLATGWATGTGVNMSAYFTTDLAGLTRTAPWDIGAYKWSGYAGVPQWASQPIFLSF